MRRVIVCLLTVCILLLAAHSAVASPGVGVVVGEPTGVSVKIGNFPVLGISYSFRNRLNTTIDLWLLNADLFDPLDWYFGVGAKVRIGFNQGNTKETVFGLGVRAPAGLQWWLSSEWELFLEVAPALLLTTDANGFLAFDVGGGIGIRYYFDW